MIGVCNCTIGPPPYPQRCNACGASAAPFTPVLWPFPAAPPQQTPPDHPLTEADVRRIVRDELRAVQEAKS